MSESHLIFFDERCAMCRQSVERIRKLDKEKIFAFEPLDSDRAKELLPEELLKEDTLILLENKKRVWKRAKAIFRIFWLFGGKWKGLGVLCYVPGLDFFYRFVAKHRHFFGKEQ